MNLVASSNPFLLVRSAIDGPQFIRVKYSADARVGKSLSHKVLKSFARFTASSELTLVDQ